MGRVAILGDFELLLNVGNWDLVGLLWMCISHMGVVFGKELERARTSSPL